MFLDSMSIFYSNLAWFHVLGMIMSWIAFGVSTLGLYAFEKNLVFFSSEDESEASRESEVGGGGVDRSSIQTQYKMARQKLVEQNLTPDQISKEKEAEAQQLAAILKLLQRQRDTFKVASMDELEDQLRLYRN